MAFLNVERISSLLLFTVERLRELPPKQCPCSFLARRPRRKLVPQHCQDVDSLGCESNEREVRSQYWRNDRVLGSWFGVTSGRCMLT
ncbi:hypothetical protein OUZ56_017603 [Daphnia magna]|uniref:Secreted protein n=1 Tax=Daphnia magna TaxID=35525 RepID=A0ABR0AT75_9CRUS|nr:hypothetical protein OUZ56_017603 [Daphnia magna]